MAVVRKGAAPAAAAAPAADVDESTLAVAGMDPDLFTAGGLMDDFDGTITRARFAPFDYMGSLDHHILGVALTIKPEDGDEFVQWYSAGELEHFLPTMDGKNPAPGFALEGEEAKAAPASAYEGVYALRVGKREQLANSSNWATFIQALVDAKFPKNLMRPAVSFVEGLTAHFNRIPQKERKGMVPQAPKEGQRNNKKDVLVVTEIKGLPGGGAATTSAPAPAAPKPAGVKAAAAPAAKAAPAPAAAAAGDLAAKVTALISAKVAEGGTDGVSRADLAQVVMESLSGIEKAKAIKMLGDDTFIAESPAWAYDPDTAILYEL